MSVESTDGTMFDGCAHCGREFEPDVRYPATVREADDGTLQVLSFCDEDCQAAWRDDD